MLTRFRKCLAHHGSACHRSIRHHFSVYSSRPFLMLLIFFLSWTKSGHLKIASNDNAPITHRFIYFLKGFVLSDSCFSIDLVYLFMIKNQSKKSPHLGEPSSVILFFLSTFLTYHPFSPYLTYRPYLVLCLILFWEHQQ